MTPTSRLQSAWKELALSNYNSATTFKQPCNTSPTTLYNNIPDNTAATSPTAVQQHPQQHCNNTAAISPTAVQPNLCVIFAHLDKYSTSPTTKGHFCHWCNFCPQKIYFESHQLVAFATSTSTCGKHRLSVRAQNKTPLSVCKSTSVQGRYSLKLGSRYFSCRGKFAKLAKNQ